MHRASCVDNAGTSINRLGPRTAHALALLKCNAAIFAVHRPGYPATSPRSGPRVPEAGVPEAGCRSNAVIASSPRSSAMLWSQGRDVTLRCKSHNLCR